MKTTITVLPVTEMKIIKQVDLIFQNRNLIDITAGIILYERELSTDYKFKEKKEEKDFIRLTTLPKQEDYPSDNLDSIILMAIRNDFPKAQVKSDLLFSSSDVEYYKNLTKRPFEVAEMTFTPDFSGIDLNHLYNKSFSGFKRQINIYLNGSFELVQNRVFEGYSDFENHERIYDSLEKIKFL